MAYLLEGLVSIDEPGLRMEIWAVVAILAKRRTDLTGDDIDTMQHVVDQVRTIRGDEPEPEAYDDAVRRSLMLVGHDPLRHRPRTRDIVVAGALPVGRHRCHGAQRS